MRRGSDVIRLLTFNPDTEHTRSLARIDVTRTES